MKYLKYKIIGVLVLLVFLVAGCVHIVETAPIESDLVGDWVSVSTVPYAKLRYSESDGGVLVLQFMDEIELYKIDNFSVNENQFTVNFAEIGSDEEPEILIGTLLGNRLQLKIFELDEFGIWFVRTEVLEMLESNANEALANYEAKIHNQALIPISKNETP